MSQTPRPHVAIAFHDDASSALPVVHTTIGGRGLWVLSAIGLVVAAMLPGLFAVGGGWLYLDAQTVTQNPVLRAWSGLGYVWLHPRGLPVFSPAGYSAFLIQYHFFADSIAAYRTVSLVLHALTAFSIWTLLRKLAIPGAWLAAALFAVHPVQTDTVAWISQQPRIWSALTMTLALFLLLRFLGITHDDEAADPHATPSRMRLPDWPKSLYVAAVLLAVVAMLFDVTGIAFAPVTLAIIVWKRAALTRRDWRAVSPMLIAGVAVLWLNVSNVASQHLEDLVSPTLAERFQLPGGSVAFYVGSLLMIVRSSFAYPRWQLNLVAPSLLRLCCSALLIAALIGLWRSRSRVGRAPFTALFIFIAMLIPSSGLFDFAWMRFSFVADHLIYLPAAVVMTVIAAVLARFVRDTRLHAAIAAILLLLMLSFSVARALAYRDQRVLWSQVLKRNPQSIIAHNSLGRSLLDEDHDVNGAVSHFTEALRSDPGNTTTLLNLAAAFEATNDVDKAIAQYYEVLRHHPQSFDAHFGLAGAFERQGDTTDALREYERAKQIQPSDPRIENNIGLIAYQRGQTDDAIADYRQAIAMDARFTVARLNLARAYFETKHYEEAADQLKQVLHYDPQSFEAYYTIGAILESTGDNRNAESYLRHALGLRPTSALAYRHLAFVLAREAIDQPRNKAMTFLNEAIVCLRKVTALDESDVDATTIADQLLAERDRIATGKPDDRYTPNNLSQ